jgi:hypothetical protein
MTNEERLEEILYQAHQRRDIDTLYYYVEDFKEQYPHLRTIDHYEMAHSRIKRELGILN